MSGKYENSQWSCNFYKPIKVRTQEESNNGLKYCVFHGWEDRIQIDELFDKKISYDKTTKIAQNEYFN